MITFNNIVERFKIFAENHFFIETFSFGSPDDVDLTKFTSFPLMHLVYTGATYDPGTKTYNLEVYILDVPADKTAKVDRQKEVVSDAEQCAEDIIADIKNGGNIFLFAQDYEVVNATTTPLEEETKNVLSGVLLDLSVSIPYEWDACNAPIDGVEPGGTEVTYARRGVLRMLTLDGATDVPSVRTIKVTNGTLTDNGDGVVTLDTGGVDTLAGLTDVDVTGVTDGQVLKYDDATGEWIPANDQSATSLGNLDDVSLATPANREALIYDGDNWVNDNVTKADVGLGNVDNTSDADKPVSTATQTALDAKADTSAVPTTLNDLSDVSITATPTGNQALIYDGTAGVFKSLPNFSNRFEDEAENNKQGITPFAERVYTVKADGDGIFIDAQSDTPTAGKVIVRKIYQKAGFLESGAVIGDFTLIHTFADDTAYSATTSTFEGFRDGDTYGTPPFTLIQTWEEVDEATEFLDSYPNAEVAYSLRKLSSTYTGNAIQVRRDSDNTTQDIGFDSNGNLDETALLAFVGSGSGYVSIFYDQSGNGRNATQPTTSVQPRIVDTGTVDKINNKPSIYFNHNVQSRFGRDNWVEAGKAHFSIFHVVQHYSILGDQTYYNWETVHTNSERTAFSLRDSLNVGHAVDWSDPAVDTPYIKSVCVNGTSGDYDSYINGTQDANGTFSSYSGALGSTTATRHGIGYRINGTFFLRGYIQEMVVYFTDQTSNQIAMQTAINDYYSVYP